MKFRFKDFLLIGLGFLGFLLFLFYQPENRSEVMNLIGSSISLWMMLNGILLIVYYKLSKNAEKLEAKTMVVMTALLSVILALLSIAVVLVIISIP